MTKTIEITSPIMSDERIAELKDFKTTDYTDCPIQKADQLREFRPRYSADGNYRSSKEAVYMYLDTDVLQWLRESTPEYHTKANDILRQAMQESN